MISATSAVNRPDALAFFFRCHSRQLEVMHVSSKLCASVKVMCVRINVAKSVKSCAHQLEVVNISRKLRADELHVDATLMKFYVQVHASLKRSYLHDDATLMLC